MACLQIYRELSNLPTFLRVHSNSKEVSYLSWQNTYPNWKTTRHIKLKSFWLTKLLENLFLAKYLISVTTPLMLYQPGFYPSTFVYSRLSFFVYCSPWGFLKLRSPDHWKMLFRLLQESERWIKLEVFQGFWTNEVIEFQNSIQDWVFTTVYRLLEKMPDHQIKNLKTFVEIYI